MDPVDDDRYYRLGLFYFNPDDERVIVPKRIKEFGFGLNFARREVILIPITIILIILILYALLDA